MKIVFVGTVLFSKKMLEKLLEINANVIGIITSEPNSFNADYANLKESGHKAGIPVLSTKNINDEQAISWVKELSPDIIFCFGWSQLIKKEILQLPKKGVVGFHPAALPKNRGRHPLIWALALGLSETASTFFYMDEGADSGDIISQEPIQIDYDDDAATLYQKMIDIAQDQLACLVSDIENNKLDLIKQDVSKANLWRKRSPKDGEIDWRMSSGAIYNLVRSLVRPYVGAHFELNDKNYIVWKVQQVEVDDIENLESGKILKIEDDKPVVKCGNGAVKLLDIQPKVKLSVGDYL